MKVFGILSLFFALTFFGCSNDDYYDLNDVVNGTTGDGGGNTDGNGFTFNNTFYSTSSLTYQGNLALTFGSLATNNNGTITAGIGDVFTAPGTIDVGSTAVVNITPDLSNPTNLTQHQSTGGTITVNSIDTDAKSVDLKYTIETADGNAVGKFIGNYQVQ